jgi:2-polyprenyl-6-methoxyphenol hydroxylase-like FAD-dependent oxidoreductase
MMLGLLLGRGGIDVVVLEKHSDFLRDFRGDTVHPSTLEVMHELGLLDPLLERPHQRVFELGGVISGHRVMLADFSRLPTQARFIALMPQWEFLDFLAAHARRSDRFRLLMEAEVVDLIEADGRVVGVRASTANGPLQVDCDLTVGADGRGSVVRERAGLVVDDQGAPIDVLWMRLSRRATDPGQTLGYIALNTVFVMLDRGDYWQCAFVIRKGGLEAWRQEGMERFRSRIREVAPFLGDRLHELATWDDVKLLTVRIDRLREWSRPGLLCLGDAAHAMSPIGGVGINLAIQDAVAAANLLVASLRAGAPSADELRRVQRRRELPTRVTQRLQTLIQDRIIYRAIGGGVPRVPPIARLLDEFPLLRRIPARLIGLGLRPEHVAHALRASAG